MSVYTDIGKNEKISKDHGKEKIRQSMNTRGKDIPMIPRKGHKARLS